jgi:oligopeptide/dipeptide ABC transporter ATP-binding protein
VDFDTHFRTGKEARVLRVQDLSVRFQTGGASFLAVDRVSFDLERGEALGLIGESGSGKTTIALSLLRLLPAGAQLSGRVELSGEDLLGLDPDALARIRGRRIAMVFHDPLAALNPVLSIGTQIAEAVRAHQSVDRRRARTAAVGLLRTVGLPAENADRYAHQLSGGMRQRALIAMSLACRPEILVADEPTSALDPIAQVGILELLRGLREERGVSLLLATHDLGTAARLCARLAVLYAGRIVESGATSELLASPRHPYTLGLLRSLPPPLGSSGPVRLEPVAGSAPPPWERPDGCRFRNRCPRAQDDCSKREPELIEIDGRQLACFHPVETQ